MDDPAGSAPLSDTHKIPCVSTLSLHLEEMSATKYESIARVNMDQHTGLCESSV